MKFLTYIDAISYDDVDIAVHESAIENGVEIVVKKYGNTFALYSIDRTANLSHFWNSFRDRFDVFKGARRV